MTTGVHPRVAATVALPRFAWRAVGAVMVAQAAVLTALSGRYGFHRDELYFLAAGNHPAWGYVDQPPLTPLLARLSTTVFGDTPVGLRVVATLLGAATVLLAAAAAREFGGGRGPQVATALSTALSGFILGVTHLVSTITPDLVVWLAVGVLVVRVLRTGDGRWWLAVGAAVGVGLTNKWLVLLLIAALGVSLLAVGPRRVLRSGWLVAGAAIALLVAAPIVLWQATHGWPQLTVAAGISASDGLKNRVMFVPDQLIYLSPVLVPVWLAGLLRPWRDPRLRWARAVALAYPVLCLEILLLGGKPYYALPMLLLFVAAGAEPVLDWLARRRAWRWASVAAAVGIVVSVLIGLPVLPERALGPVLAVNKESGEQVGWPRFVDTVAAAWQRIPPEQRGTAVILTRNYGQAGAIQRYGPERGLPTPYSGHMSYADWGPPPDTMTGPVLLVGRFPDDTLRVRFADCHEVARNDNGVGVANDEQGTPVTLCSRPAEPWSRLWPGLRRYY
ncbi:glycosyltransferase family 39 protein [Solihabitans fulvus]|uniref:glycosyltransferase family 39 protein n=1 Tax=Solihabitans fulvus TaxID=1892852 RepID=UPI001CB76636|nr:glycosyltransferase family 39 protein [Solihabitans fulvus]